MTTGIGSGLSAQLGMVEESVYGTYVAPTRFLPFDKESLSMDIARLESKGIGRTSTVDVSTLWTSGKKDIKGNIELAVVNKSCGLLFKHMLGSVAITTPGGGTNTRDHTHTLGDLTGKSLTVQVGRPDTAGTIQPFTYTGVKIMDWELSNDIDNYLQLSLGVDGANEVTTETLATKSFATALTPFSWTGATITIGGASYTIKKIAIKGKNGLKNDRYGLGSASKIQPLQEDLREITAEFEIDFSSLTAYTLFTAGTLAAISATWQGALIEGALYYQVVVTMPVCRFDGEGPNVESFGRLKQKIKAKAMYDGSQEPLTIVYRTIDTAS